MQLSTKLLFTRDTAMTLVSYFFVSVFVYQLSIPSFVYPLVYSCTHLFTYLLTYLFIHLFIRSFVRLPTFQTSSVLWQYCRAENASCLCQRRHAKVPDRWSSCTQWLAIPVYPGSVPDQDQQDEWHILHLPPNGVTKTNCVKRTIFGRHEICSFGLFLCNDTAQGSG